MIGYSLNINIIIIFRELAAKTQIGIRRSSCRYLVPVLVGENGILSCYVLVCSCY